MTLYLNNRTSFKDLDSPEDDHVIVVDDSDEDEEDEVHTTTNAETEDTSVPKSSSPSSLPTKLKDLPSNFNEPNKEVKRLKKQVHELEIELPEDLKEIPTKLEDFTKTITSLTSQVAELKTLQWELLVEFLSLPVRVASVQANLKTLDALSRGEEHTSSNHLPAFSKPIPLIITTTTQMQSPLQIIPKSFSQLKGEHIKKEKDKKEISLEEAEKESTNSDSNDDDETHVTASMVESSTTKKLKKFDFITEDGRHIHLIEEEINHQKKLEEDAKAEAAKQEGEVRKAELVDMIGLEVVNKY
uniref:Uncharacterized protein n=1 Tax=Tanacetum cinerariifolium TaxID=118510 RepID=A0A699JL88_TANCI|nr:hypothetical protein [Tanacetum cinerariifolium]